MTWLDIITYVLYGCGALILLLFIANLLLVKKRGEDSALIRRLLYVVAIIAVILGIIRAKFLYSETVLFANVMVLLCLIISFVRSEKPVQPLPDEEENGEHPQK